MIIAIDYDGTCVRHEYPKIGKDIGAVLVLKELIENGHKLVLNTMRSGKELAEAVEWFKEKDIPLFGVNENPEQKSWTKSPKVYAHLYIDDAALCCPLLHGDFDDNGNGGYYDRPHVDWEAVRKILVDKKIIVSKYN